MNHSHFKTFFKSLSGVFLVLIAVSLLAWRAVLYFYSASFANLDFDIQVWGASYQVLALVGAIAGLVFSGLWGGWKSVIGRASIFFSLGLFGELFGNSISSYYTITGGSLPYPSIADLGFFSTIPLYTLGVMQLARAGGAKVAFQSFQKISQVIVIPLIMLCVSFFFFLNGYQLDWSNPLKVFLDFGYPIGDALYISAGILAFTLTRKTLGGIMKLPVLLFISALVMQYAADFTFLFENNQGTFVVGEITDLLYLAAYFLMAASLMQLAVTYHAIKEN